MTQDDRAPLDDETEDWPSPADKAHAVEQARQLRDQAAKGGLRFEAYLQPGLAEWLLDRIERGGFRQSSTLIFHASLTSPSSEDCPSHLI